MIDHQFFLQCNIRGRPSPTDDLGGFMNHFVHFERAVKSMKLPGIRKKANSSNALWFIRKGFLKNREDPKVVDALYHAQKIVD